MSTAIIRDGSVAATSSAAIGGVHEGLTESPPVRLLNFTLLNLYPLTMARIVFCEDLDTKVTNTSLYGAAAASSALTVARSLARACRRTHMSRDLRHRDTARDRRSAVIIGGSRRTESLIKSFRRKSGCSNV